MVEFIGGRMDCFYLQTEIMDWTTYDALIGYDLWHRRLHHHNIEHTIQHKMSPFKLISLQKSTSIISRILTLGQSGGSSDSYTGILRLPIDKNSTWGKGARNSSNQ